MSRPMRTSAKKTLWTFGAAMLVAAIGCGRAPQISRPNQPLIEALRTAASSRMSPWIDQCAEKLQERKQQGAISSEEGKALQAVIDLARAGKWREAEVEAKRLGKAQDLSGD